MEPLYNLLEGFSVALSYEAVFFCFVGVAVGTLVGALPGVGALATISMLLPVTFYIDSTLAIIMLAGIFYGSQYGSSIAATLLNIPGTSTAAVTCLDGYPMTKKGRSGQALFLTTISSFFGGSVAIVAMMWFAPVLADLALDFQSVDYFSVMLLALVAVSFSGGKAPLKGLLMVAVGIALGLVGTDVTTGQYRMTFGVLELADGISLVPLAMGLFGVAEIIISVHGITTARAKITSVRLKDMMPSQQELRQTVMPTVRGSALGSLMGVLPGAGPTLASFLAYSTEKSISKTPERFGQGAVEGITAPEAANNAAVQAAFIPTLSLGIPGDAVMAVLLGALLMHGITPGPQFISSNPDMFWALVASFWIGNVILLVLNIPLIGIWVKMLSIPYRILYPTMLFFICVGVYSISLSAFDVFLVIIFGLIGYGMWLARLPVVPLLLGFILGPMIEENFRRVMLVSGSDPMAFVQSPYSLVFLSIALAIIVLPLLTKGFSAIRARVFTP
ncbi:MAG: tripartite tricarboxylate transporter permease [Pelagibacterium sp.]|uniref:tripartite tricarboxylate transporter permease n=1 Tax=Pelagibacterium sp. TaxID=1967288 RepID=UPI0032EEEEF1